MAGPPGPPRIACYLPNDPTTDPDYGIPPPHDWDGRLWPSVADGRARFLP